MLMNAEMSKQSDTLTLDFNNALKTTQATAGLTSPCLTPTGQTGNNRNYQVVVRTSTSLISLRQLKILLGPE